MVDLPGRRKLGGKRICQLELEAQRVSVNEKEKWDSLSKEQF